MGRGRPQQYRDYVKIRFHDVSHIWPGKWATGRVLVGYNDDDEDGGRLEEHKQKRKFQSTAARPNLSLRMLPPGSGGRYIRLLSLLIQ
ncbi:hypothetical protein AAE478_003255 [Parahypoxylon ruwenzoriense]